VKPLWNTPRKSCKILKWEWLLLERYILWESDFLGLGGGWGLYEPPQEQEKKTVPVGFLGLWFATFIFVIVFFIEMALVK